MKKVFLQLLSNPLIGLLFRYGIVGVVASIVHFSVAYMAFTYLSINSFTAHFCGFMFGLFTAYFGHYFYSFKDNEQHGKRFPKFLVTALVALILHQGGVYILVEQVKLDYTSRVLPLLVVTVPVFTFLLNKFWVFAESKPPK
ncbi:MAG: GtrA family protein [Proteobacteria bacterium]|nr:GtrA family protein [Pseudomonadota bacterium]